MSAFEGEREALGWLAQLARDERAALRSIYDRFAPRVQSIALHILRDPAEAEDLVQETFVEVWKRRREFDPARGSVASWVVTIARTRSLTRAQARASARRRDERIDPPSPAEDAPGPGRVEARENKALLDRALGALPPEQRRAIELAYYEGLTQQQIAEREGDPLGTVKTRVRLGMQKLATLLLGGEG